jgi:hypothetical protein
MATEHSSTDEPDFQPEPVCAGEDCAMLGEDPAPDLAPSTAVVSASTADPVARVRRGQCGARAGLDE